MTRPNRITKHHRPGLTVVELLVVIFITATITGLTLYGFSIAREDTERTNAVNELQFTVEAARASAMSNETHAAILFFQLRDQDEANVVATLYNTVRISPGESVRTVLAPTDGIGGPALEPGSPLYDTYTTADGTIINSSQLHTLRSWEEIDDFLTVSAPGYQSLAVAPGTGAPYTDSLYPSARALWPYTDEKGFSTPAPPPDTILEKELAGIGFAIAFNELGQVVTDPFNMNTGKVGNARVVELVQENVGETDVAFGSGAVTLYAFAPGYQDYSTAFLPSKTDAQYEGRAQIPGFMISPDAPDGGGDYLLYEIDANEDGIADELTVATIPRQFRAVRSFDLAPYFAAVTREDFNTLRSQFVSEAFSIDQELFLSPEVVLGSTGFPDPQSGDDATDVETRNWQEVNDQWSWFMFNAHTGEVLSREERQ